MIAHSNECHACRFIEVFESAADDNCHLELRAVKNLIELCSNPLNC